MMPAIRTSIVVGMLVWLMAAPAAQAPSRGNSAATITGAFADSCRSFAARSSKDISYVDIHYVSGVAAKDETIGSPEYVIEGGAGEEIAFAVVKSGTTTEAFDCVPSNSAPTALLEIKTPPLNQLFGCAEYFDGSLMCDQSYLRTAWTNNTQFPRGGGPAEGLLTWGCGAVSHPSLCSFITTFRISGSSDPDGDLTTWTLDFGDGTSVSGAWSDLPSEIAHDYAVPSGVWLVTLTVTDSAGHSASDVIPMGFINLTPD